ncbi:MAG: M20 family metallopeptidase [Rhizobiales bacterium]|nr:M20 family metallopeptidase [Hyphomicrobiales bacterium]
MQESDFETRLAAEIAGSGEEMLGLLEKLVNTDSPSRDKNGVDAVGDIVRGFLEGEGIEVEAVANDTFGDVLKASVAPVNASNAPPILLMGHRDTVFPLGEAKRRPFRRDGERAYGPGVGDMKGGLVINAFVLRALKRLGGAERAVAGLFTSDEEIGSPSSRPVIEREAAGASAVFNSEPGRASGNVVTGRKGGMFLQLDVEGKAAHSGAPAGTGISAIEAIARKVIGLHGLVDAERGISLNVGVLNGGEVINMVAPHARAEFDLRYVEGEDRARMLDKINEVVMAEDVEGSRASITVLSEFLPFEQSETSRALLGCYVDAASEVGFEVSGAFSGGCADSGFASATGTPTLCGTGPVGGGFHTEEEYIELSSVVPRAKALALAVVRAARM